MKQIMDPLDAIQRDAAENGARKLLDVLQHEKPTRKRVSKYEKMTEEEWDVWNDHHKKITQAWREANKDRIAAMARARYLKKTKRYRVKRVFVRAVALTPDQIRELIFKLNQHLENLEA